MQSYSIATNYLIQLLLAETFYLNKWCIFKPKSSPSQNSSDTLSQTFFTPIIRVSLKENRHIWLIFLPYDRDLEEDFHSLENIVYTIHCRTREYLILFSRINISCKKPKTQPIKKSWYTSVCECIARMTQLKRTGWHVCCFPCTIIRIWSNMNLNVDTAVSKTCSNNSSRL